MRQAVEHVAGGDLAEAEVLLDEAVFGLRAGTDDAAQTMSLGS
ncbi:MULTISPECIES: hypothetical protein [Streptomyces]|nr:MULTISPECIES: hypothetical protein [Streptomyces]